MATSCHFPAELALEAWALLQDEELPVAPATALAASLPSLAHSDALQEHTLLVLSQSCPGFLRLGVPEAEVPLVALEQTLQRSQRGEGEVHFIDFWRSLGEVSKATLTDQTFPSSTAEAPLSSDAECTLPIGPLGPATVSLRDQASFTRKPRGVMNDLEDLRDIMLDLFEVSGNDDLPMARLWEAVEQVRLQSKSPEFWQKLQSELHQDHEAGECINLENLTVFLLLWLREAAAYDLSAGAGNISAETSPAAHSEADLSMMAQHLEQALESTPTGETRSHPSLAAVPTSGYESTRIDLEAVKPNFRSAMLNLSCEMAELNQAEGQRGWMRSAMLQQRCNEGSPTELVEEETTCLLPSRQPGLRKTAAGDLLDSTCLGPNAGWKQLIPTSDPDSSTAIRPVSPLPEAQSPHPDSEVARPRAPVFLHIYDVTQEPAIQRLNKVLAHKRMPLKFGGIFHAGVEVSGTEWSYGCTESEDDPGVLPNLPKMHPDHHYRQTVEMRRTNLSASEVGDILEELSSEYTGPTYDLLRKNCCHFADDFCRRLGAGCIPAWVYRLARIAARVDRLLQAAQRIRMG